MFQYLFNDQFIFYPTDNSHFTLAFGAYELVHVKAILAWQIDDHDKMHVQNRVENILK